MGSKGVKPGAHCIQPRLRGRGAEALGSFFSRACRVVICASHMRVFFWLLLARDCFTLCASTSAVVSWRSAGRSDVHALLRVLALSSFHVRVFPLSRVHPPRLWCRRGAVGATFSLMLRVHTLSSNRVRVFCVNPRVWGWQCDTSVRYCHFLTPTPLQEKKILSTPK